MSKTIYQGPRIYVSHSPKDNEFGVKLVEDLRRVLDDESAVWYDVRGGLQGGDALRSKIREELTSRDVFIVILSPDAMASSWVNAEIDLAWRQKSSKDGKLIIPVLYRPCKIRTELRTIQYASFLPPKTYEEAFNELLVAIRQPMNSKTSSSTSRIDPDSSFTSQKQPQEAIFKPPRIFVAHSHKDNDFSANLVRDLRYALADDTSVWSDTIGGLQGGESWWSRIVEELSSRDVFIVILSPDAMDSEWVKNEINLALRQKSSEDGKRIIPVLYRQCKIRADLATLQVISFLPPRTYDAAFNELLIALGLSVNEEASGRVSEANIKRWLDEGNAHYRANRFEEALGAFERAIQLEHNSALAYYNKGRVLSSLERYEEALASLDQALSLDSKLADVWTLKGFVHRNLKRYKEALVSFDQAIALNPSYAYAYQERGRAYADLRQYEQAIADYTQAIRLDPSYAAAYSNRGAVYANLKQYERAIADYHRVLELDPLSVVAYNDRGNAYLALRQYEQALANYDQALALDSQSVDAYYGRGSVYANLQKHQRAIEDFDRTLELDPKLAWAYAQRGEVYCLIKEYGRAIEDFNRALELDPRLAWAYSSRGQTYSSLEVYERAIEDFNRAIELEPNDATTNYNRGLAYADLLEYQRAIEDYNRCAGYLGHLFAK